MDVIDMKTAGRPIIGSRVDVTRHGQRGTEGQQESEDDRGSASHQMNYMDPGPARQGRSKPADRPMTPHLPATQTRICLAYPLSI